MGRVANIGVHGQPATLHLETLWTTGRDDHHWTRRHVLDTYSQLALATHQLDGARFATHHFVLDQFIQAYEVFSNASETGALKVVLTRTT